MLIKCPNYLEIKNGLFNLNGNNVLGPGDFGGVFYHSCWEIIVRMCGQNKRWVNCFHKNFAKIGSRVNRYVKINWLIFCSTG